MRWKAHRTISARRRARGWTSARTSASGQATVEAAFLIPVLFTVVLMLIEPGIVLYDRTVMESAASDACRMLATCTGSYGMDDGAYEQIVRRHLGAVPQQELFHVHEGGCSWNIEMTGDETSGEVAVRIENKVRLLPLIDAACRLAGVADAEGCMTIAVEQSAPVQPAWAAGQSPDGWVYQRG